MGDIMYKIYLRNNNFTKEIRRFNMPRQADFNAFRQKLKTMFPTINNKNFTISWNDGPDTVSISSDEEFKIANREMISISKINVDIQSQENESMNTEERVNTEKVIHYGVSCDGCDNIVVGFRYKCVECENFDLCSECEAANKHPEHYMLRMPQPLDWHHNRRFFHHLGKFLKKSGIECNRKRHGSDRTAEFSSRTIHRHIYPWMEASLPYLNNFIDTLIETHIPNDNSSNQTQQTEKEQQSNEETTTNKNKNEDDSKKSSGEEKKLSDEKDDKVSQSDTASVASQVSSMAQSSAPEEWTIVDNNETSEVNETPTTSSGVTVTSIKQIPTTSMAPSAPSAPGQTFSTSNVYPELPKEKEIFHPDPTIHNAIEAMIRMGFSNQGGLLTYLLSHEKGDINRVLEILQPTKK